MNRTDISSLLEENLQCDTLLVVGDKSSFLHTTETMYQHTDKSKSSILRSVLLYRAKLTNSNLTPRIDDVGDVLVEAPGKVAQSILLFCQGIGLLTSVSFGDRMVSMGVGESMVFMMVVVMLQRTLSTNSNDGARRTSLMSMEEYDKPNMKRFSVSGRGEEMEGDK